MPIFAPIENPSGLLLFSRSEASSMRADIDEFGYCSAGMLQDLHDEQEETILAREILF
jgi:predicted glycosyl hydrolase (DUF1957 family)